MSVPTTPLTRDELRYLRKVVRYRNGLRQTLRPSQALHGMNISPERVKYIEALAVTFTS